MTKYTEEEKKKLYEENLSDSKEAFKKILTNIRKAHCAFVPCKECPFDLREKSIQIKCGYVELDDLISNMRGI